MEEKIIAVAAGREITEAEFNAFVARVPQEQQQFVQTPEGRHQALTQYANYFLFEKMGEEKGYDKTAEFLEILEGTKRELLSQYALTQLVKDVTASEEECKAYYEEHVTDTMCKNKAYEEYYLGTILSDTSAVTGLEMIRRTVGMANVKDITTIADEKKRARAEKICITAAIDFIRNRDDKKCGKCFLSTLKNAVESVDTE